MPYYDLKCGACGIILEGFQAMNAKQPTKCEVCGRRKVRRMIEKPPAFRNTYNPMHPRKNRGRGY